MLEALYAAALADSKLREELNSARTLEERIGQLPQANSAIAALAKSDHIRVIAEIKRRSPSKGFLAEIPNPAELARIYQKFGADAISVLTESSGFAGSLDDLSRVAAAVDVPVLRKDFISTEYQLLEARSAGADFALLILAGLTAKRFAELFGFAQQLGLEVLVETHSKAEIELANETGAQLIGINTRNLKTFELDMALFEQLAGLIRPDSIAIAESSVKELADVQRYRDAGADAVLIGEALVTGSPEKLLPQFRSVK